MSVLEYPKPILDAYSAFEAFRRLGFPSDDIFFIVSKDGRDPRKRWAVFVVVKQRRREFSIAIGGHSKRRKNMEKYFGLWVDFVAEIKKLPADANGRIYADENPYHDSLMTHYREWLASNGGAASLVTALTAKGFNIPKAWN